MSSNSVVLNNIELEKSIITDVAHLTFEFVLHAVGVSLVLVEVHIQQSPAAALARHPAVQTPVDVRLQLRLADSGFTAEFAVRTFTSFAQRETSSHGWDASCSRKHTPQCNIIGIT